jgi:SAM-dependent methyltransferase
MSNADGHERLGHYRWMAEKIAGQARVLEIGCGDGRSTLELLRQGHTVVSIDENHECLHLASRRLEHAGYTPRTDIERGSGASGHGPAYELMFGPIAPEAANIETHLIHGDVGRNRDPELERWLKSSERFDAVICWLVGTHKWRRYNTRSSFEKESDYGLDVQNYVYELAARVLKPRGWVSSLARSKESSRSNCQLSPRLHQLFTLCRS